MIDSAGLTKALRGLVVSLEDDLRVRADRDDQVAGVVSAEFARAEAAGRTALSESAWREGLLTQVAVGWVLATVFVRFCEDNGLVGDAMVSGPGDRGRQAQDAQTVFYRGGDALGERDYLLHVFEQARGLPGLNQVLGEHNPLWLFGPSEDGARLILSAFRAADDESGELIWDFTDADWETRFLGDLYQDLSEAAKKNFALLQTPDFVESFILDRTLDPAIDEFGLDGFAMIDPACGSGHFLLGSFDRLFTRWQAKTPTDGPRANAARALTSVNGVDINPFAAAIAKFRLLVAALKASNVSRLLDAPVFELRVATGDSLLHAPVERSGQGELGTVTADVDAQGPAAHLFATEDGQLVREILGREYDAVVANPPYITPKDSAASDAYRARYSACHKEYQLTVPFMELIFRLARRGAGDRSAGFVGKITGNGFTKRDFGEKIITEFLASDIELSHVIDLSGCFIPGHTTPTILLLGRNRLPGPTPLRVVLGASGEPVVPTDPAKGLVWSSIVELIDLPGEENDYISVRDSTRKAFHSHPWSLEGGRAMELMAQLEHEATKLIDHVELVGYTAQTNADDVFIRSASAWERSSVRETSLRRWIVGHELREYELSQTERFALYPYGDEGLLDEGQLDESVRRYLWPYRSSLWARRTFNKKSYREDGRTYWEWHQIAPDRVNREVLAFPSTSTHNHFVAIDGGPIYNRHAPFVLLSERAGEFSSEELHGLLNSSAGLFWMKQVMFCKGNGGNGGGIKGAVFDRGWDFDCGKLEDFPLVPSSVGYWSQKLRDAGREAARVAPSASNYDAGDSEWSERSKVLRREMVSAQEELDWAAYSAYSITEGSLTSEFGKQPPLELGERAFEIALARRVKAGELTTTWFSRHGSTPITELPRTWDSTYCSIVERRIALIDSDWRVKMCERPEYKRRWNWVALSDIEQSALEIWLLNRLEARWLWSELVPVSVEQLADRVRNDGEFLAAVHKYAGFDADLVNVIGKLVSSDAVPFLAAHRYKASGLRKREEWALTWQLQRLVDEGNEVPSPPVPPQYRKEDFQKSQLWNLRGKFDVPKERFVSYPGAERPGDGSMLLGWAGWDHLQQAQALASLIGSRQTADGWGADELAPLLAGLAELVPWLQQWHNDLDEETGQRLGDFYDVFVTSRCAQLGLDRSQLAEWRPPAKGKKKATT